MIAIRELPQFEALQEDAKTIPSMDPVAVLSFLSILIVAGEVDRRMETHFARYDLSQARFLVLMLLRRRKDAPASPADLAEGCSVTRATMTGLLDGLEADALVERTHRKDDRRMIDVRITKKGLALLDRILPDHYERISSIMTGLTKAERKTLTELLAKVRDRLKDAV